MVELAPNMIVKKAELDNNEITVVLTTNNLFDARTPQTREKVRNYVVKKFKMYDAVQHGYEDVESFDEEKQLFDIIYKFKSRSAVQ